MPLHVSSTTCSSSGGQNCIIYSLWYYHTETSEWSKITKITKIIKIYKYEHIVVKFMCEFFGFDYCVLLTINMLITKIYILRCTVSKTSKNVGDSHLLTYYIEQSPS